MKVLFISYYFEPFPGVGAKRITYWATNLHRFGIESHVLTATEQIEIKPNITFVKPQKSTSVLSKVIKDEGLVWMPALTAYVDNYPTFDYDIVVFSGGPFMHFGFGNYLKKKYGCKIVLDYRDPFGNNPRHQDGALKKKIKMFFEKRFNRMADAVTTVNEICKRDMSYSNKVTVIPNGYDEQLLEKNATLSQENILKGKMLNGGKLYPDFNITPLLNVVKENELLSFDQIGAKYDFIDELMHPRIISKGFVSYNELLSSIRAVEFCLVLTGGKSFETPTKTYDYIGLNKKILVITEGEPRTGGLQSILIDYPNVAWAQNNETSILNAINSLQALEPIPIDTYAFSRAASLEKLLNLLKSC
jgi:glycosyltransferase involved in cell wall biosynthesis